MMMMTAKIMTIDIQTKILRKAIPPLSSFLKCTIWILFRSFLLSFFCLPSSSHFFLSFLFLFLFFFVIIIIILFFFFSFLFFLFLVLKSAIQFMRKKKNKKLFWHYTCLEEAFLLSQNYLNSSSNQSLSHQSRLFDKLVNWIGWFMKFWINRQANKE